MKGRKTIDRIYRLLPDRDLIFWIIWLLSFLGILLLEGEPGYVIGGDTEAYYLNFHHHIGVAPGYPLFLHILHGIFGERLYLSAAALLQILILSAAIVYLVHTIWDIFHLCIWEIIVIWLASLLPFIILLPEDPIGHTLMTESLSYPIFYFFMAFMLRGVTGGQNRYFVYGLLAAAIMEWVRPQMLFTFAVLGIAFFYVQLKNRIQRKKREKLKDSWYFRTIAAFFCIVLTMQAVSGLTRIYEKVFFDAPALDYSDQTLVQRLLYVAQEEDAVLFEDELCREIFEGTWEIIQKNRTSQEFYKKSWTEWSEIFKAFGANSRILGDVIREKLEEKETLAEDAVGQEIQVSQISHEMTVVLLKAHWKEHLVLTLQLLPKSFISTVFFHKEKIYALILAATGAVYFFGLVAGIYVFGKCNGKAAAEWMMLVMGTSVLNALACDLVLAGLQRYMAYTLGMTWIGVFLLVRELYISERTVWGKETRHK